MELSGVNGAIGAECSQSIKRAAAVERVDSLLIELVGARVLCERLVDTFAAVRL